MTSGELELNILQRKLDALTATYLHERYAHKFRKLNQWVEYLSIAVPVFYAAPRYLVKGTAIAPLLEITGEILGAVLLVLAILKLVFGWQQSEVRHSMMLRKNSEISDEAQRLLDRKVTNRDVIEQFLRRVRDVDDEDRELLPGLSKRQRQEAYRESLKHVISGQTMLCMICGANPWHFTPGRCEACGGSGSKAGNGE